MTNEKSLLTVLSSFDEALKHLSELQQSYEEWAEYDPHADGTELSAALLSNAVGRFLVDHGYEATL